MSADEAVIRIILQDSSSATTQAANAGVPPSGPDSSNPDTLPQKQILTRLTEIRDLLTEPSKEGKDRGGVKELFDPLYDLESAIIKVQDILKDTISSNDKHSSDSLTTLGSILNTNESTTGYVKPITGLLKELISVTEDADPLVKLTDFLETSFNKQFMYDQTIIQGVTRAGDTLDKMWDLTRGSEEYDDTRAAEDAEEQRIAEEDLAWQMLSPDEKEDLHNSILRQEHRDQEEEQGGLANYVPATELPPIPLAPEEKEWEQDPEYLRAARIYEQQKEENEIIGALPTEIPLPSIEEATPFVEPETGPGFRKRKNTDVQLPTSGIEGIPTPVQELPPIPLAPEQQLSTPQPETILEPEQEQQSFGDFLKELRDESQDVVGPPEPPEQLPPAPTPELLSELLDSTNKEDPFPEWEGWDWPKHKGGWNLIGANKQEMIDSNYPPRAKGEVTGAIDDDEYFDWVHWLYNNNRSAGPPGFAEGGSVPGEPKGKDTVPAWLSPGEYVVNSDAAMKNRKQLDAMNDERHMSLGGMVWGATKAVGSAASSAIDMGTDANSDTASSVGKFGSAISAVGEQLAVANPVIGGFVKGVGMAGEALGALMSAIDKTVEKYGEYSPEIAQAQAIAEIRETMGDLARSQEAATELARYVEARSELQQKIEDIKVKLLMKITPAVTMIVELLEAIMPSGQGIETAITALLSPLETLGNAVGDIANVQREDRIPAVEDPTTQLTSTHFGQGDASGRWVPNL